MSRVLVLDANRQTLMPCTPARARILLAQRKAAVFRRFPLTLILHEAKPQATVAPLRLKIDPGAKTAGIAILHAETSEVLWAAELRHRGEQVRDGLRGRRIARRSRRARNTHYRAPRFRNRRCTPGWLPPSLLSRIGNVETWVARLRRLCPINALFYELARFDTQLLQNPELENLDYLKGTLFGIELRHYLLAKWGHRCAYCQATAVPLEMDHVEPRARGGSDRVANRVPACHACNQAKADKPLEEFLADRPEVLAWVQAQRQAPLKDAAAVNASGLALYRRLQATGLSVETGPGALTKWNRQQQGLPKAHWVDAACCGVSTPAHVRLQTVRPWLITATDRQNRQMRNVDKHGFPVGRAKGPSQVCGFRTGDLVKATCPGHLKAAGTNVGRVLVRTRGIFDVQTRQGRVKDIPARYCQRLQAADGYRNALGAALPLTSEGGGPVPSI